MSKLYLKTEKEDIWKIQHDYNRFRKLVINRANRLKITFNLLNDQIKDCTKSIGKRCVTVRVEAVHLFWYILIEMQNVYWKPPYA